MGAAKGADAHGAQQRTSLLERPLQAERMSHEGAAEASQAFEEDHSAAVAREASRPGGMRLCRYHFANSAPFPAAYSWVERCPTYLSERHPPPGNTARAVPCARWAALFLACTQSEDLCVQSLCMGPDRHVKGCKLYCNFACLSFLGIPCSLDACFGAVYMLCAK